MTLPRGSIAIGNYDFRSSGTVAKSIEIATAAVAAGLPAELWVMRDQGPFRERVPASVPIFEVSGKPNPRRSRSLDLLMGIPSLARAIATRRPSVFLSGGNHLHLPAKIAIYLSGNRRSVQFGVRASNSSFRPHSRANGSLSFLDRLKYKNANFIVAVANDLGQEISRSDPSLKVHCIPNGVDIERVRRLSSEPFHHPFIDDNRKGQRPLAVTMGRISHQKGFDLLIQAMALLPPQIKLRLLVIGEGSAKEIKKLHDLAAKHRVAGDIFFAGYQSNPFAVMSKADLFVSASRWEGASNALNEALVCGLSVVATDCPTGNREALKNGLYGTLVPVEDPQALANGIVRELGIERHSNAELGARELDLKICLDKWVKLLSHHLDVRRDSA